MDPTVIVGYAGGYRTLRLHRTPALLLTSSDIRPSEVTLEFFHVASCDDMKMVLDPQKPMQTFKNSSEAWAAAGKELGWM